MTILATIILLGVLIFVHELGHFWAAKAVGVGVERFSIGLGPRLWGYTRGETEYVLSAIPLGGYVKMQGMEDEVMEHLEGGAGDTPREPSPRDFDAQPLWARAFVISAGVIMNMIFAFVVYASVAAVWGVQEFATTQVMSVEEGSLPPGTESLAGVVPGAVIVQVGDERPETWQQMQELFVDGPAGPVTIVTESPAARFDIEVPVDERDRRSLAVALRPWVDPVVGELEPGTPAVRAGIERGDVITTVAGIPIRSWDDMMREIGARPGERVEIGILRDGEDLVRIAELSDVADGEAGRRGRLGVYQAASETVAVSVGAGEAISIGAGQTVYWTRVILDFLKDLFTLNVSPRSVGSIGTIAVASGQAAEEGVSTFLRFMAFFSINLAVLNLLPIPILDGGHLVFLGVELVRGQGLTIQQRVRWSQVGLVVVVGIMVWALGNDLLRALGL